MSLTAGISLHRIGLLTAIAMVAATAGSSTCYPLACEDCGGEGVQKWRLIETCPACEGRIKNHGIAPIEG